MRIILGLLAVWWLGACSASDEPGPGHGDILTIYGAIGAVDRGAVDAELEPVFGLVGAVFDTAQGYNRDSLLALEQHQVRTDFPAGRDIHNFSGPLLRDVLAVAIPQGDTLLVTALDGYQREISLERITAHDVILAISLNDQPLGLGGLGPSMLVWPRQSDTALAEMSDDDWVYGIVTIEVR